MVTATTPVIRFPQRALFALLAALLMMLPAVPAQAASLSASVDRDTLSLDETLTLTLRYDSRDASGQPDLGALEPFFDILGQSQSRQLRIINGQSESFTQWQYTLAPKIKGRIRVPAFELDDARSQPFEVLVTAPVISPNRSGSDTFIERIIEPESAYVGQQLRVRVRLNTAVGLSELQITPLEVDDAKLLELEDRQYQRTVDGRPYLVYEKNYALFPEQAGSLELPAQRLSAVKGASRSLFDRSRGQVVRLRQEAQTIAVEAAPVASDWLPADALRLEQSLIGNGEVGVGEPVTLQLTLVAEGADPARLPLLNPPSLPGVKVYPEPAEDEQQLTANGVVTVRSQRFALVPTEAGPLSLPPLRQRWWNNQRGRFETAESLALELDVQPSAASANASAPQRTPQPSGSQPAAPLPTRPPTPESVQAPAPTAETGATAAETPTWWLWSQLLWALLCAGLAWGWWRAKRQPSAITQPPATSTPMPPDTRAAEQQLRAACSARDPAATRQALLAFAQTKRLVAAPVTLETIKQRSNGTLAAQLDKLDQALYFAKSASEIDFDTLYREAVRLSCAPGVALEETKSLKVLYS